MNFGSLNYWPVLIAAVASFLSAPSGTASWQAMDGGAGPVGGRHGHGEGRNGPPSGSLYHRLRRALVMAWMFAGVLLHMGQGGMATSLRTGVISGFFLWLGFVITTMAVNHAFQGAKRR